MIRKTIINIIALCLVVFTMLASLWFISNQKKKIVCSSVKIVFNDDVHFVTEAEIEKIIQDNFGSFDGVLLDTLNTFKIKQAIEQHAWIQNVDIFKGYAHTDSSFFVGVIKVIITHQIPLMRVANADNGYYVSSSGNTMPLSGSFSMHVPVFTGHIPDSIVNEYLLPFAQYIHNDDFLRSLFVQIDVKTDKQIEIVPRVGNHTIEFGYITDIDHKIRNLKAVYTQGFGNEQWEKYKKVSLKYKNQVVCSL